eukprot:jgi/Botrbrau1/10383/Bobra.146_2s0021.1
MKTQPLITQTQLLSFSSSHAFTSSRSNLFCSFYCFRFYRLTHPYAHSVARLPICNLQFEFFSRFNM